MSVLKITSEPTQTTKSLRLIPVNRVVDINFIQTFDGSEGSIDYFHLSILLDGDEEIVLVRWAKSIDSRDTMEGRLKLAETYFDNLKKVLESPEIYGTVSFSMFID